MTYIYQGDSRQLEQEKDLKSLLTELPASMHARALRYKFKQDAFNFVLGRLLLKRGLKKLGLEHDIDRLNFQENGKPFLGSVFFNISHSENLVVCILSTDGVVGIDVEKEKQLPLKSFRASFSEREWLDINSASDPYQRFYWYWTRKESIIKALGVNIFYLHKIEVDPTQDFFIEKGKSWHLRDMYFGTGYFGAVCSEFEIRGEIDVEWYGK